MYDSYKIMEHLEKEVDKKAESGIRNITDLDTVVKLSEAMKNFAKTEYYCTVTEAMQEDGHSYDSGYSERRKRDGMGRYSRHDGGYTEAKERYMEDKHSYRSSRSPESKRDMNVSLHDCMTKLKSELQDMMASADTREERDKIKEMIQEIGRLA